MKVDLLLIVGNILPNVSVTLLVASADELVDLHVDLQFKQMYWLMFM